MEIVFKYNKPNYKTYLIFVNDVLNFTTTFKRKTAITELLNNYGQLMAQIYFEHYINGKTVIIPKRAITLYSQQYGINKIFLSFKWFPNASTFFTFNSDSYASISHNGYKTSIFKNDKQIAYYQLSENIDNDWEMKLVANDDIDLPLTIAFCLHLWSDLEGQHAKDRARYNISFWSKKFDEDWRPNMK